MGFLHSRLPKAYKFSHRNGDMGLNIVEPEGNAKTHQSQEIQREKDTCIER